LLFALVAVALQSHAGEAADKDKTEKKDAPVHSTWRPFKELADVLYYEGFEHHVNAFDKGKVADVPVPPGGHAWRLETTNDDSFVNFLVNKTQLKLMNGLNPTQVYFQASFYADEVGTINIKFIHEKGDYERNTPVPKPKMWNVITMKISELKNKDAHPEA